MSTRRPVDPTALDRMVLGTDADEDLQDWEALLQSPDAGQLWEQAVEDRRRLDLTAALVRGRPWLAGGLLAARGAARALVRLPDQVAVTRVEPMAWAGSLSGGEQADEREEAVGWGEQQVVELGHGERLTLALPNGAAAFYRYRGDRTGRFQSWLMEEEDAPVLVVVVQADEHEIDDFDAALASGLPTATLILLNRGDGENGT